MTNAADVAANCVTVYSNQFSAISLPLTVAYENATNYVWYAYTDWTPGPVVHTNGVVNVAWLKAKGEMPPNAVRVIPLRTEVTAINAETDEERAFRIYAPDTAFEIDLALIGTNTVTWACAAYATGLNRMKIDWGDGTVITNASVGYWGTTYTHTYPAIGKYVLRASPIADLLYGSTTLKPAITRVLRFADPDAGGKIASPPTFRRCVNLRAFDDGTLARWPKGYATIEAVYQYDTALDATRLPDWPEGVKTIHSVYGECTSLVLTAIPEWPSTLECIQCSYGSGLYSNLTGLSLTRLPEWPASLKVIGGDTRLASVFKNCTGITATELPAWPAGMTNPCAVYGGCRNIKATLPDWPAGLTAAERTYSGCSGLTGTIPAWGESVVNAESTYSGCSGLTGTIPAWGENVANANSTYSGCSGLTGTIPAWGAAITQAYGTYQNCRNLTGAWTDDPAELMPTNITSHGNCVYGASAALRALFYSDWGGTRTKEE